MHPVFLFYSLVKLKGNTFVLLRGYGKNTGIAPVFYSPLFTLLDIFEKVEGWIYNMKVLAAPYFVFFFLLYKL